MSKFQAGDSVRVIESKFPFGVSHGLIKGFCYNVEYAEGTAVKLEQRIELFHEDYFELIGRILPKESMSSFKMKSEQVHSPKHDVVNNPKHYQLVEGFEVKDLMKLLLNRIEESDVGFTHFQSSCYKEAMQYFLRFMLKNGQEDIQKGVYYMNEVLKEWQENPE